MDTKDRELIRLLQGDARVTTTALARELGLSRATVQTRMARLEAQGVIRGYTVRVSYDIEQRQIRAHVMISVYPKQNAEVAAALVKQAGVRSLYAISGEFDLIAITTWARHPLWLLWWGIDEIRAIRKPSGGRTTPQSTISLNERWARHSDRKYFKLREVFPLVYRHSICYKLV